MSDIYNKNAREAHLMAEAYNNIYNEDDNKEIKLFHPTFASGSPKIVEVLANAQKLIEYWMEKGFKLATPEEAAKYSDEEDSAEDAEYETEADAYRAMSDGYKAEDSHYPEDMDTIKVGNIYKGESYHELVVGVKGDEVFTKKITLEDGNRYDGNRMLDEVKLAGKLNVDFLNEVL